MEGGSDASTVVNDVIDNAFSGTNFFDTLMENEEYHARYYSYLQQLVDEYLLGDGFETFYQRTRSQIDDLVATDPNTFYSYEEYVSAVDTLYQIVKLRGESIDGQLNGSIPSTSEAQRNSDALIDASNLDLSSMSSMNTGGDDKGGFPGSDEDINESDSTDSSQDGEQMQPPEGFDPSQNGDGQMQLPEGFDPSQNGDGQMQLPEGFDPSQNGDGQMQLPEGFDPSQMDGQMPEGFGNMSGKTPSLNNIITYGISIGVFLIGLLFVAFYHRKKRKG